ncbi:AAA family ATPase [Microbacterium mangrovi]|uniref:AAA family ATPase n=1 Tax=Microbacterium mangrovi TaxID=1348253 RepID=UPI00069123BC|nr:AAA family ATPase [Microbacterium mangrovi]
MRGGLERWKRGVASHGVRQALGYAFDGTCDSHIDHTAGIEGAARYGGDREVTRYVVTDDGLAEDLLDASHLETWLNGDDPDSREHRGRRLESPAADLVLDGTINAPKSFSIAALLDEDVAEEFEALQDRLRTRVIQTWQRELNARRGTGGRIRESLRRIEVVELQHRRSRALDPHIHRHLWLNVKVQGDDGQWSNVDSRVAMKLHTVINAEGELAARTDPDWIAALARHGYTLNADGEIAQLTHLVRPLSRRSNQIETNRATHLARWRAAHPGQEPSRDILNQIDRWAWASGRPNKPDLFDETEWEQRARSEVAALDPEVLGDRNPIEPATVAPADLDRDLLAALAIVDADNRSTGSGGRFSRYDVRAGAMRAVAATRVCADRSLLQEVIDDVTARALNDTVDLLHDEADVPAHIKHLMSAHTATLKLDLVAKFDALSRPGADIPHEEMIRFAARTLPADMTLDEGQVNAAAAIAGSHQLVTIIGPAGSGKTTMLRLAHAALTQQRRRMVIVAPTRKAATVAAREIGTATSSLHALLLDHGWRHTTNPAREEVWTRLRAGQTDPASGRIYDGPSQYPVGAGDRIVVDEAGMVDLQTAYALAVVAEETGAGIVMVGDDRQARPVGHSGAMACMARRSGAVVEMSAVHRFHDPEYAALTLRMRNCVTPEEAATVALQLAKRGSVRRVESDEAACRAMVEAYVLHSRSGKRVALVTAANSDAHLINEAIQRSRLDAGQLLDYPVAFGLDGQRLLVGDVVQTRRNDRATGVQNRATWIVDQINGTNMRLASTSDATDVRVVSDAYVAQHVHLAYATTVHGIQGETADVSIVGPGVDAAGLYVGMTRGRESNVALVVAQADAAAYVDVARTLLRSSLEATIADSRRKAIAEVQRAARSWDPSRYDPPQGRRHSMPTTS